MSTVAVKPTKAIVEAANLIYEAIGRYIGTGIALRGHGKYESHIEARVLFVQVIRHVEAITELAKIDLVLLPAALVLSRASFETTARILWMLQPDDVFDREARFLAHLAGEEGHWLRAAALFSEFGRDVKPFESESETIRQFRTGVETLLPSKIRRIKKVPDVRGMLRDINDEKRYGNYMRLSQFSHGCHAAGRLYRKGLGNSKKTGEFIYPESWAEPLSCSWWCLAKGGSTILHKLGEDPEKFYDETFFTEVTEALNKV
jgi:hypothetical protein